MMNPNTLIEHKIERNKDWTRRKTNGRNSPSWSVRDQIKLGKNEIPFHRVQMVRRLPFGQMMMISI